MSETVSAGTSDDASARSHNETVRDLVSQKAIDWGRSATAWVVENPELSLGLALALGVGIGLAVKRR